MGSFSYGGKYPASIRYNNANVNYLKFNNTLVWIRPNTQLVNMTSSANLSYIAPIAGTYRIALVGGGGNNSGGGHGGSGGYCTFDISVAKGTGFNFHCGGAADDSSVIVNGGTHIAYHGNNGSQRTVLDYPSGSHIEVTHGTGGEHTDGGANGNAGNVNAGGASVYDDRGAGGGGTGLCRMWIISG